MTCICKAELSCRNVKFTYPGGNKHTRFVVFAKLLVGKSEDFIDGKPSFRKVFYDCFCGHHKHCGRDSLARNIGGKEKDRVIVKRIEIVEISADLFRRNHLRKNGIIFRIGENRRQSRKLNLLCIFKLLINPCGCLCYILFKS